MKNRINTIHKQFANYFRAGELEPFLYLLSKRIGEANICLDLSKDFEGELLEAGYQPPFLKEEIKDHELVAINNVDKPFVYWNNRLYFQRYFKYEEAVHNRLKSFSEGEKDGTKLIQEELSNRKEFIQKLFGSEDKTQTDWQQVAALSAVLNKFSIITGGPGTGKTTTVAKILTLLLDLNPEMRIALAAPTGKAAARMAESLKNAYGISAEIKSKLEKLEPLTLHRLLGYKRNSIYFRHNSENQLPYDLIIIDESSMIDFALFAKLLDAIKPESRLIMLGDKDQLASVEAGSLFGDLCQAQDELNRFSKERVEFINSFIENPKAKISEDKQSESSHLLFEHIIELQHSYRFSDEGGIGKLSRAIINNESEEIRDFFTLRQPRKLSGQGDGNGVVILDGDYSEKYLDEIIDIYSKYIQESDIRTALKLLNEARVLCAVREGEEGVYALNWKIEQKLRERGLLESVSEFYENRPVMVTSNNYELGLFNGDTGIVRKDENGQIRVWFEDNEGKLKSVLPSFLEAVETVFAMTIHKSQGSEFTTVLTVLPRKSESGILTRELLYTAVTRAKEKVIVWGEEKTVLECCERRVERGSGIGERLI